jgi:hypothetical protein
MGDRYAYQLFAEGAVGQIGFVADDNAASLVEFSIDSMEVPRSFGIDDNDIFLRSDWLPRLSHSNSVACRWEMLLECNLSKASELARMQTRPFLNF